MVCARGCIRIPRPAWLRRQQACDSTTWVLGVPSLIVSSCCGGAPHQEQVTGILGGAKGGCTFAAGQQAWTAALGDNNASTNDQAGIYRAVVAGNMSMLYDHWAQQSYFAGATNPDCPTCVNWVRCDMKSGGGGGGGGRARRKYEIARLVCFDAKRTRLLGVCTLLPRSDGYFHNAALASAG
jgi:hypothetical protein